MKAIRQADSEKHPAGQAGWIDDDNLKSVVLDGRFDMERVAELLSEQRP